MNPEEMPAAHKAMVELRIALNEMRLAKPEDRSEEARRCQILITEMEKVVDLWELWIVNQNRS